MQYRYTHLMMGTTVKLQLHGGSDHQKCISNPHICINLNASSNQSELNCKIKFPVCFLKTQLACNFTKLSSFMAEIQKYYSLIKLEYIIIVIGRANRFSLRMPICNLFCQQICKPFLC